MTAASTAAAAGPPPDYAELQVTSNFSFLRGAAHPGELVETAAALGHRAIAITDRNSLAGVVRAHIAAEAAGIPLIVGSRLVLKDAPSLLALATDRAAYGSLSQLLSLGKRRAGKGGCRLFLDDLAAMGAGLVLIAVPPADPGPGFAAALRALPARLPEPCHLAASVLYRGDDRGRLARLAALAEAAGTPLVATNDVRYHRPERRPLHDVLCCIREGCTIQEAGFRLAANAERHLKPAAEMARLFREHPRALARTLAIAERCRFSLSALRHDYPDETDANGRPPQAELAHRVREGAGDRYPAGLPAKVAAALSRELALIERLGYAPYFLTVHDMVRFARARGILCQGRGSAANSAVCYCLGITAVDPDRTDLLFERFISAERGEPPDIDVDFEHERREEVIRYIYGKYGRDRAALAAVVIRYRARSAVRDVGKAMGLSGDTIGALAGQVWGWRGEPVDAERVREAGLDPGDRTLRLTLELARRLIGFPRHLSQHVGGFVITRDRLDRLVPIENAAMAGRTVIEWDKDDLDALGILKVDVLALGMLSCMRRGFDLLRRHHGRDLDLAGVPDEDPAVYDMLCRGDSLGVFQVESRAQMAMLPRLRPRSFYDLVIEVAIVRPGPIQGDMVHPYLRRRNGEEAVSFPSEELRQVLGKTLGVPLFQEQAMRIAIIAAGFTPAEADRLRRAMATFRHAGQVSNFERKMIEGMVARGYDRDFATRCFRQIEGFGDYGFPESHAASFALLVYVSSWLKCHYPAVFACALLNAQPMGFYAPAQIIRDAREHGVEVRPPDINHSGWDSDLEPAGGGAFALRLGLRQIKGLRKTDARLLADRRGQGYAGVADVWRRTGLPPASLETLARGDAFASTGTSRREAFWAVRGLAESAGGALPLFAAADEARRPPDPASDPGADRPVPWAEPAVTLPPLPLGEAVVEDYAALRLSLRAHPLALLRRDLAADGCTPCRVLERLPAGRHLALAGLVLVRQRPGTARGVIFVTLEDETGIANVIVWPDLFERQRRILLGARLLRVAGRVQREGRVIHVIAGRLADRSAMLARLHAADARDMTDATGMAAGAPRAAPPPQPVRTHPRRIRPELTVISRNFH